MSEIDYAYIAENIANISYMPVRIYENDVCTGYYTALPLTPDPANPYLDKLLTVSCDVCCCITPLYQYYGIIRHVKHTVIIGPVSQLPLTRSDARELLLLLGLHENEKSRYLSMLRHITPMPLEVFLHMLCLVNYYISGEKRNITELGIFDYADDMPAVLPTITRPQTAKPEADEWQIPSHNTYEYEQEMLRLVTAGNTDGLQKLFANLPAGQP